MIAGLGKVLLVVLIVYFEYLKNNLKTRKHSSRMRTARLPSVHASVSSPDVGTGGGGARGCDVQGGRGWWVPCPMSRGSMSDVQGRAGDPMSDVQGGGRNGVPGGGWVGWGQI